MGPKTIRISLDIPKPLHRDLLETADRQGCSARQLILRSIERIVEEERRRTRTRLALPLVRASGRQIGPFTNDGALFS